MKTIRIATRQSALALWQTRFIAQKLQALYPSIQIELVGLTTTGDKITDRPLAAIGGKALFVKELEQALLLDQADIAVHSLKDVPADLTPGFDLAAICEREDPRDAFLSVNYADLMALPKQAKVGTSSYRRKAQLLAARPDLQIFDLRGNVDTRIRKLKAGEYDAIILAYAGVKRLGLVEEVKQILPVEISLPAAGQGAVAVECLANKPELQALLLPLNHVETRACVLAERSMNQRLQGDCYSPIGSFAEVIAGELQLRGLVASADGKVLLRTSQKGKPALAETIGQQAAEDLLAQGAKAVLCSH
jgi:hydroxymethylbilane synthase